MYALLFQVAMCNFQMIKDAADVAMATMLSGIQVQLLIKCSRSLQMFEMFNCFKVFFLQFHVENNRICS